MRGALDDQIEMLRRLKMHVAYMKGQLNAEIIGASLNEGELWDMLNSLEEGMHPVESKQPSGPMLSE